MTSLVLDRQAVGSGATRAALTFVSWQAAGFIIVGCHVYLAAALGQATLSFAIFVPLVTLLYAFEPLGGFVVMIQALLYQNFVISTASASLDTGLYHALQGTSFALMSAIAGVAVIRVWMSGDDGERRLLTALFLAGLVFAAYAALGAQRAGVVPAAIYLRSASGGLVAAVIGLDLGRHYPYRVIARFFVASLILGFVLTAFEITMTGAYYNLIDVKDYSSLKYLSVGAPVLFYSSEDVIANLTSAFFNITGGATSFRFNGPNMHSVSYGYVLAVGAIAALSVGWRWPLAVIVPLLLLIGVKGAAVLLAATLLLWAVGRRFGAGAMAAAGVLFGICFVAFTIDYGLSIGDYHVIGLLGGVDGFMANPLGNGLGVGGNLAGGIQWDELQRYGADFGMESAIGVLLYQMGIGAAACGYVIWRVAAPLGRGVGDRNSADVALIAIALFVVVLTGCFQEEAFSPYALGTLMLLGSAALAELPAAREPA